MIVYWNPCSAHCKHISISVQQVQPPLSRCWTWTVPPILPLLFLEGLPEVVVAAFSGMALKPGQPKPLSGKFWGGAGWLPQGVGLSLWGTTPHHPPTQPLSCSRITSLPSSSRPQPCPVCSRHYTYIYTYMQTHKHTLSRSLLPISLSLSLCLTAIQSLMIIYCSAPWGSFHFLFPSFQPRK